MMLKSHSSPNIADIGWYAPKKKKHQPTTSKMMVVNHLPIIYQLHPFDCYSHVYIMVISILYPDEIGAVSRFQSQKKHHDG